MSKPIQLSVKVIIFDDQGRILVLRRSFVSKGNPGKWDFPGGKIDPGEDIGEAARREALEETGLEVEIGRVHGAAESESPVSRVAYLIFKASVVSGEVTLSDEHDEYAWVSPHELAEIDLVPQFKHLRF